MWWRLGLLALIAGALGAANAPGWHSRGTVYAAGTVEVTSAGDEGGAGGAVCPDAERCTLRHAIEQANADEGTAEFSITFSSDVFPPGAPVAIDVGNSPLPNISRAQVTIDGAGAGVVLRNASTGLTVVNNGLTVTGPGFKLTNFAIQGFAGSCLAIVAENATVGGGESGNSFGGCAAGIAVGGAGSVVRGNTIGFTSAGAPDPVATGIVVSAANARIGAPPSVAGGGNTIGNAAVGIFVGAGGAAAFSGVQLERNTIGRAVNNASAPVGTGVLLSQPSNETLVTNNTFANADVGVAIAADADGVSVTRNRLVSNIFDGIGTLAIDLGADGIVNPSDVGDSDTGPNGGMNHPAIIRATQTRVTGVSCAGCQVQIYVAVHQPGGAHDYGLAPLSGGIVTADASGQFTVDNPAASPGDWLIALASDADGNSSEFGPSARVGAGSVLCGNVQLHAGWNHVGYFGSEPVTLLGSFTPVPSVTAIYRLIDGTGDFERWFATTPIGRTLTSVQPGESYWLYAETAATLPGGFSLSFPLPVQLKAGWNDFVYLGASEAAADALGSLSGEFDDLYHYDGAGQRWLRFGGLAVPSWAREFQTVDVCGVYQLRLDEPATLVPLQP